MWRHMRACWRTAQQVCDSGLAQPGTLHVLAAHMQACACIYILLLLGASGSHGSGAHNNSCSRANYPDFVRESSLILRDPTLARSHGDHSHSALISDCKDTCWQMKALLAPHRLCKISAAWPHMCMLLQIWRRGTPSLCWRLWACPCCWQMAALHRFHAMAPAPVLCLCWMRWSSSWSQSLGGWGWLPGSSRQSCCPGKPFFWVVVRW